MAYIIYMESFFNNNAPSEDIGVFIKKPDEPPPDSYNLKFEVEPGEIEDCLRTYFENRKNKMTLIISGNIVRSERIEKSLLKGIGRFLFT